MKTQIENWISRAKAQIEKNNTSTLNYTIGRKYYKVVLLPNESVYCFIDFEGNIYKPANYKTPAKGIRGTVVATDPTKIDAHGAWLYRTQPY